MSKYVRLKRYDPKHGIVLKQYCYQGIRFLESSGWYLVDDDVADYLEKHARQKDMDPQSLEAFEICTEKQARTIDEKETLAAKPRRLADKARVASPRGLTSKGLKDTRTRKRRKTKAKSPKKADDDTPESPPDSTGSK